MKPYVNFTEFEKCIRAKRAMALLHNRLFPTGNNNWAELTWEQVEGTVIEHYKLTGKARALFLGHSKQWAESTL